MTKTTIERVPTGIPGLDELIEGGFPAKSITRLTGAPGTGKTIACGQWCAVLLKLGYKPVFFCFEQSPEEIKKQLEQFGIDLSKVEFYSANDMTYDTMLGKKPQDLSALLKLLLEKAEKSGSKHVIIDSMSSLLMEDGIKARLLIRQLINGLKKLGVTALVTSEAVNSEKGDDVATYLVDNDINMGVLRVGKEGTRALTINKMRNTNHPLDEFLMEITKKGLIVKEM